MSNHQFIVMLIFVFMTVLMLVSHTAAKTAPVGMVSGKMTYYYSRVILVDCDNGSNNDGCGSRDMPCKTFALAVRRLQNNTLISIPSSRECQLTQVVNITGYNDIGIAGNADFTLVCTQSKGLYLAVVNGLLLVNITFTSCGAIFDSASINISTGRATEKLSVAVYVLNVTNVEIHSAKFNSSTGIGLAVYNTNGNVSVINCNFTNNHLPQNELSDSSGGGGMLLHYSYCTPGLTTCNPTTNTRNRNSTITIKSCHFEKNKASSSESSDIIYRQVDSSTTALGKGGGIEIVFAGSSSRNMVTLQNLVFYNNSAESGGALGLVFKDNASLNAITIIQCMFQSNMALFSGGALRIAIEFYNCDNCVSDNSVIVKDSVFVSNFAKWGSAVTFFSSRSNSPSPTNTIEFYNCVYDSNIADVSVVDVVPDAFNAQYSGFLPIPVFGNCTFVNNILCLSPLGILNVQSYVISFKSSINFHNNSGTALYLFDASAVTVNCSQVNFTNNTGTNGGGVTLIGSSNLKLAPGTHLNFTNNKALGFGGAIYYYSTSPSLLYSHSCFIDYYISGIVPGNWSGVNIHFAGNMALVFGHAIYATTLFPCARAYGNGSNFDDNVKTLFTQYPFTYRNPYKHGLIGTTAHELHFKSQEAVPLAAAPGQAFQTGLYALDELNQTVDTVIHTVITRGSEYAAIDSVYSYTANGIIQLTGIPHDNSTVELSLQTTSPIKTETRMHIVLTECPPGFYLKMNSTSSVCRCSVDVISQQYHGISHCDDDDFQAILNPGYWGGCLHQGKFVTGQCPLGFCDHSQSEFVLPHTCTGINDQLCGSMHRKGILCGECEDNYTVYYHSNRYKCGKCKYHELGMLFYALTELLPVTILFIVIVIFGVSFTSGPANSFIFFAQVLNFFDVTSLGSLQFPDVVVDLTNIYQFIFGAFNFDFFKLDIFSFCLWKNAKILDVFVFKYVTTTYAILLLVVFILGVRCIPRCYSCLQRCVFRPPITSSLIQGISALLIISYTQCAKVSFQILTAQSLRGGGLQRKKTVVFLSGQTDYFSRAHLPYAIPAVFVIILTTIPPILLIVYPKFTKFCKKDVDALSGQGDSEHDHVSIFSQWQIRFTPFFDSFQGCFKDNCRYFSGLFFIYRLAISMAFALSDNGMELYFTLEVIVIIMLALHAIAQPYKHTFFNKLDTIIFADLALINGLSIYNFYWAQFGFNKIVAIASSIQVALIYLPLTYMAVMVALKIGVRFEQFRRLQWIRRLNYYIPLVRNENLNYEPLVLSNSFNESHLPPRLFEEQASYRPPPQQATTDGANARVTL